MPVLESYTYNDSAGGLQTNVVLTKPASVAVGNLLMMLVMNDDLSATPDWNAYTGWTLEINDGNDISDCKLAVYWRIADGTEGATETPTCATNTETMGWYLRISGNHATAPIHLKGTALNQVSKTAPEPTSFSVTGVTTTVDGCLIILPWSFDGGDCLPFSVSGTGWPAVVEDENASGTTSTDVGGGFVTRDLATAGASNTCVIDTSRSDGLCGIQFAIAPSSGNSGNGALVSGNSTLTAEGLSASAGNGGLPSDASIVSASGIASGPASGNGTLSSDASAIFGNGSSFSTGDGNIIAVDFSLSGSGAVKTVHEGSGNPGSDDCSASGSGISSSIGNGSLLSGNSSMRGSADTGITLSAKKLNFVYRKQRLRARKSA